MGKVIHTHPTGECDVVYEADGSLGLFLSSHNVTVCSMPFDLGGGIILDGDPPPPMPLLIPGEFDTVINFQPNLFTIPMLPPSVNVGESVSAAGFLKGKVKKERKLKKASGKVKKEGKNKKAKANVAARGRIKPSASGKCSVDGCKANGKARGLCAKHGGTGATCSFSGCDTKAQARGRCTKHGANGLCIARGCHANVKAPGFCQKHKNKASKVICNIPDCSEKVSRRGLCVAHDRIGICSIPECSTKVKARGLCYKHGAHGLCMHDGCSTPAHNRGLCVRHGGNGTCNKPGCTSNIRARGLCHKHRSYATCTITGCTTNASERGLCVAHGFVGGSPIAKLSARTPHTGDGIMVLY